MKSNFIPVGKAKKKPYRIIKNHDKILEEFEKSKFKEEDIRGSNVISELSDCSAIINRAPTSATQIANAMWWQRMGMMRIERQFLHNVVDEVASRQREIEPIDIKDVENLLMFDMEGNEL